MYTLPPLAEIPRDVRDPSDSHAADEVVYRLALKAQSIPGLPATTSIDDIEVHFVKGPVRGQHTELRQRHQLPVLFDKHMTRRDYGAGELVAVLSLRRTPVPADFEEAFGEWRARALAAAGMLASVLDERVVGEELFEDAVLLHEGEAIGAVDMRGRVRTFLPFDVTTADRSAIDRLRSASLSESSAVARASRLYRRAALEGPTADAYAMLWVAAECFSEHRSPSRKDIEAALRESGLNPDGLPIHVGHLIDLRGKIQHHGLEDHDRLGTAFYEMEAVVRALIRRELGLQGGWWPASNDPAGFAEPFDDVAGALRGRGTTEWHAECLPPATPAEPQRLPRNVTNPSDDPRVEVEAAFGEAAHLIASVVIDALEWQDQDAAITVRQGLPPDAPADAMTLTTAQGIWLAARRLDGLPSDADDSEDANRRLLNLIWDLHGLVATVLAQRAGFASEDVGVTVIEACAAWAQYRRLVVCGPFDPDLLVLPTSPFDPLGLGKLTGWAAAGDARAIERLESATAEQRRISGDLIDGLRTAEPGAPLELLQFLERTENGDE